MCGCHGDDSDSSHLRAVQVGGEHDDGVRQHVGRVCTGKQSLSAEEETQILLYFDSKNKKDNKLSEPLYFNINLRWFLPLVAL